MMSIYLESRQRHSADTMSIPKLVTFNIGKFQKEKEKYHSKITDLNKTISKNLYNVLRQLKSLVKSGYMFQLFCFIFKLKKIDKTY